MDNPNINTYNHSKNQFAPAQNDNLLNIWRIIGLGLRYWYFFFISIPVALAAVFIYHHYSVTIYSAQATLLFKGAEDKVLSSSNIMGGVGLSAEDRKIENQTFILRSHRISRRTIDRLDYGIEYYAKGRVKDTEMYHSAPFEVVMDSSANQLLNVPIYITFISDNSIRIEIVTEGSDQYHYSDHSYVGNSGAIDFKKVISWDEPIGLPCAHFHLKKSSQSQGFSGKSYFVKFRSHDNIASEYRSKLNVSSYSEGSSIMFLSVTGSNPAKLKRYLDELSQVVLENNLTQKNDIADRSLAFIQKQLDMIADTLDRTQNLLLNFRKNHRITEPLNAGKQMASEYYALEQQQQKNVLKSYYFKLLKTKLNEDPYSTDFLLPVFSDINYPLISQLVSELLVLNNEYQSYSSQANSTNPFVAALVGKIEVTRNNLLLSINKALESIAIEDKMVVNQLAGVDSQMDQLPEIEKEFLRIDRNYKLNDAIYTFLLQKNSETQITKASNSPDNEIVDQATVGGIVSPNKKSNYSRALLIAFALPIGLIFLIEFLNVRIRDNEDIKRLVPEIPLLGQIPHSKNVGNNVILDSPHSKIAEAFRSVRTRLSFLSVEKPVSVIAITSTNTGDGKTFISINLASAYAVSGKRTIMLGFDLRRPKMSELFNLRDKTGISNYLIGQVDDISEICYSAGLENLFVMASGDIPPNPSELIGSHLTSELFKWLSANFDIIVVDLPPVGVVSDARLILPYSDVLLYIARNNHTRKDHFQQTVQYLISEQTHSMGILFNDVEMQGQGYGTYYSDYYVKA